MTIWYSVKLKKKFDKYQILNRANELYVQYRKNEKKIIVWDGYLDFEYLSIDEAITHLKSERDSSGKPIKIQTEELDMKWFKCIYQNNTK